MKKYGCPKCGDELAIRKTTAPGRFKYYENHRPPWAFQFYEFDCKAMFICFACGHEFTEPVEVE